MQDPTGIAELQQAEAAFRRAFAKASYTDPFGTSVRSRLLLYPIAYTILNPEQYAALGAASGASCRRAYFAAFGGEERGWGGTYAHRLVDLSSYDEYVGANPAGTLEHFLYGIGGDWGLVTSDGEYALLGGNEAFVASFADALGYDQDLALKTFIYDWREAEQAGASVGWVPILLDHVLGPGQGRRAWLTVH